MVRLLPVLVLVLAFALPRAGSFLIINRPAPSDVAVVLGGSSSDNRLDRGLQALREGLTREVVVDADGRRLVFGKTLAQMAQAYSQTLPPQEAEHIHVCPIQSTSTVAETAEAEKCFAPLQPHRVLIVTSDYHTRRALSIFQHRLPQYQWSTAAAYDTRDFRADYWHNREWLKTTLVEWEKLLYWELFERWSKT